MDVQYCADTLPVIGYVVQTITKHLSSGQKVLWLVPGGSAIKIASAISKELPQDHLSNLRVTLTDERFGPVGHADSNWKQLVEAGFDAPGAQLFPVLTGKDFAETVSDYDRLLETLFYEADYIVGLFGMGADGHTAGILPESPAVHDEPYATGYEASNFTRLTMTPKAIMKLDESVVYAMGVEKLSALKGLVQENISLDKQPAQVHKTLPKSTLFTDQELENNKEKS